MNKFVYYAILSLVAVSLCATGCGRKEPPKVVQEENKELKSKDGVDHKVLSFNLEGLTEKGEKKWEVIGRTAKSISENEIKLGNITAKTYGDEEARITADEGIYDKSKNNVRLEKNVKATIENMGSTVKDQIGFSIEGPAKKGEAKREEADKPKAKKKMIITCTGEVEFDYAKNLVYFKDNVKVRSDDGDIDADKMTINLDPATRKVNDIVAEGHVKITQKENTAYSDNAKYSETNKTASLKGNPKMVIAQDEDIMVRK
ncbi:MAG: LPS export ABC transporter periplasmic protein LptC [Candidatus Omnitrophica bacterium]|nr:LPS export ABC transporter periplasmic protein LptC [Candidatus Omnitrophota bacterium]